MERLSVDKILNMMTAAFQQGYALDLIDISGERDKEISDELRFCYDAAEAAFNRIDVEALFENAEGLEIPRKYPEFYDYLSDMVINLDEKLEKDPDIADIAESEELELEEAKIHETSIQDKVLYEIINGHHTGKERDSEKWVEHDAYRQKLTEEYRNMILRSQGPQITDNEINEPVISVKETLDVPDQILRRSTKNISGSMHDSLADGTENIIRNRNKSPTVYKPKDDKTQQVIGSGEKMQKKTAPATAYQEKREPSAGIEGSVDKMGTYSLSKTNNHSVAADILRALNGTEDAIFSERYDTLSAENQDTSDFKNVHDVRTVPDAVHTTETVPDKDNSNANTGYRRDSYEQAIQYTPTHETLKEKAKNEVPLHGSPEFSSDLEQLSVSNIGLQQFHKESLKELESNRYVRDSHEQTGQDKNSPVPEGSAENGGYSPEILFAKDNASGPVVQADNGVKDTAYADIQDRNALGDTHIPSSDAGRPNNPPEAVKPNRYVQDSHERTGQYENSPVPEGSAENGGYSPEILFAKDNASGPVVQADNGVKDTAYTVIHDRNALGDTHIPSSDAGHLDNPPEAVKPSRYIQDLQKAHSDISSIMPDQGGMEGHAVIASADVYTAITGDSAEVMARAIQPWAMAADKTNKYIMDSYAQVGFYEGINPAVAEGGEYLDILADGKRNGDIVAANLEGRRKQYTVRGDGTISVNNQTLMIYGKSGDVHIGWKGAVRTPSGNVVTPMGTPMDCSNSAFAVTKGQGHPLHVASISTISGMRHQTSENDFIPSGGTGDKQVFVPAVSSRMIPEKIRNINNLVKTDALHRTILIQGGHSCESFATFNLNELNKNSFFTDERIGFLADSYQSLLSSACKYADAPKQLEELQGLLSEQGLPTDLQELNKTIERLRDENSRERLKHVQGYAAKFRLLSEQTHMNIEQRQKLNASLEDRYLSAEMKEKLALARQMLEKEGITQDVEQLTVLVSKGRLSPKQLTLAKEYLKLSKQSRKEILRKGILLFHPDSKIYNTEQTLYKNSIAMVLEKEGLPTNGKNLFECIRSGTLNQEKEKIAAQALKLLNLRALIQAARLTAAATLAAAKKTAELAKTGIIFAKNMMNRYMADDYTMRGALVLLGVASAAVQSVKIAKRSIRMAKLIGTAAGNTAKAVKSGISMTVSGAKSIPKAVGAAKKSIRWVKVAGRNIRILGFKRTGKKVALKTGYFAVKAVKNTLKIVVRLLVAIASSVGSILLPVLIVILVVLGIVLSIMAFIKNTGEEVYYDAGDEDTTAVVQEMVDVLTLCHASFRDSLSNQFGGGVSTSATGTNSDGGLAAPQLKKGESSAVKDQYDVTSGTWWNQEFTQSGYFACNWASGTKQQQVAQMLSSGSVSVRDNGGLMFIDEKYYAGAFTSYWGSVGDVLKIEFEGSMAIGDQPASNTMYVLIIDIKAFKDTHYPEMQDGLYGHQLGGHRDFAEMIGTHNLNNSAFGCPVKATNMGSILDGTCDLGTIGTSGGASSSNVNADIYYRQVIDQETYRDILNRDKNLYYTFPEEQEAPDGITPEPTHAPDETGEVYGFYNNNQELVSMVLALFDFDINDSTSVKKTTTLTSDTSEDPQTVKGVTDKIDDDTWKLITLFDENGLDFESTGYSEGGYDDLKYSALVGLFNASHIVCGTPVYTYHEGPDGTINPEYDETGRIVGQNNTDGKSYEVPVMRTYSREVVNDDGTTSTEYYTDFERDSDGDIVYETHYSPCQGHLAYSADVITLHYDALLNLNQWWEENIYSVDNFDEENPEYSSNDPEDDNYKAKETTLKRTFQYIKKPDFYKSESGTCSSSSSSSSSSGFSPGTMTESQAEVAKKCYEYMTTKMGLTSEQAYGVLVNIKRESDFNYTSTENSDGSGGYGLCQWTGGRRSQLIEWCNAHPESGAYNTIEGQMAYLNAEFNSLSSVWTGNGVAGFRQCTTAREAGEYFIRYFERPAEVYMNQRISEMDSDIATVKSYVGA